MIEHSVTTKPLDNVRAGAAGDDESVQKDAEIRQRSTLESESLLDQAAGFARNGDYLGALARARLAEHRLTLVSAALPAGDASMISAHAHLDLRIHHYDLLVREWQIEVEARRAAYLVRERRAIEGDTSAAATPGHSRRDKS